MLGKDPLTIALKNVPSLPHLGSEKKNNMLMHSNRIYVPETLRKKAIKLNHDDEMTEHYEIQKNLKLMLRNYYGPNLIEIKKLMKKLTSNDLNSEDFLLKSMKAKIEKYIEHCVLCRKSKTPKHKFYGELINLPIFESKGTNIILNFVKDLFSNMNGKNAFYDAILMMINRLTKMAHYFSITKNMSVIDLFKVLNKKVFKFHDLFDFIIFDRNFLIISKLGKKLTKIMKFDKKMSTVFHSQTDKQTKRQNSTMKQYFRTYVNFQQNDGV